MCVCACVCVTGNLTATLVAKPVSKPASNAVEVAIDELKHGIVGLNVNGVNAIVSPCMFWGAGKGGCVCVLSLCAAVFEYHLP